MADKISMVAKAAFTNPNIQGPRTTGAVLIGETFKTDWLHARELRDNGLADAVDAKDLDVEPKEPLEPSNQVSVTQLKAINDRRAKAPAPAAPPQASVK